MLVGTEVKSLRNGKASIAEAFISIDKNGEVWIQNMNIPHYNFGNIHNHEEFRKRKLLLHKKEIAKIALRAQAERLTLIPTSLYFKSSKVKVEFALAKGKKQHDKRQDAAKKTVERKLRQGNYD